MFLDVALAFAILQFPSTGSGSTVPISSTTIDAPIPSFPPISISGPKICMNPQLSCQSASATEDTCCFSSPGGSFMQTQFWDTKPSTGPSDHWTIHGLWPDHCDGSFDVNCDRTREYSNITEILQSHHKTDLLNYMNKYWKGNKGNDPSFWAYEWNKHGTCINTLKTGCYTDYKAQEEVADYFQKTVDLFQGLNTYAFLATAGILPSNNKTYTRDEIYSALEAAYGYKVGINCSGSVFDEAYYYFNVLGSVQTGEFVKSPPNKNITSCPTTGIKYLPKYQTITEVLQDPFSGKGYLNAYTGDSKTGCLISFGTWLTTGTCATYNSVFDTSSKTFTLKSSKGPCGVVNDQFSCGPNMTYTPFTAVDDYLAYEGSNQFYAGEVPIGSVQQAVYTTVNNEEVKFKWQSV